MWVYEKYGIEFFVLIYDFFGIISVDVVNLFKVVCEIMVDIYEFCDVLVDFYD